MLCILYMLVVAKLMHTMRLPINPVKISRLVNQQKSAKRPRPYRLGQHHEFAQRATHSWQVRRALRINSAQFRRAHNNISSAIHQSGVWVSHAQCKDAEHNHYLGTLFTFLCEKRRRPFVFVICRRSRIIFHTGTVCLYSGNVNHPYT
jgi:hypothetical protein